MVELISKNRVSDHVKTMLLFLLVFAFSKSRGQTTIFSENMGNPGGTTAIAVNAFQNGSPIAFSGTGDVRATSPSSGYTGASGGGNVFLTNGSSKTFQICGINTSACSSLILTFGVNKSAAASPNTELQIQFSSDGGTTFGSATTVTITGGAVWSLQTISTGIPSAANICIKFINTSATVQFRIDDVKLTGTCGSISHTVTFNANTGTGSMSAQTASTTTNLTNNAFAKTGCTFAGWNTAANGSGTTYSDGQAYSFAADLVLYAQWNCGSTCPYFVAAVVNGCAGSCSGEGNNEFVVMNSGSYSIPVNGTDLNVVYNNGSDQFFTQSYAAQPGIISNLNSLAGCGTLFVDASTGTIPPNSTFFIMNQGSCFNSGSFSAYCGVGTIYVAFSTDATWSPTGFFTNSNAHRYFKTDFSSINAGCGPTVYDYNASNQFDFGSNGDGSSVTFNGTTASYVSGGGNCVPPVTILPISLIDFYGTRNGEVNELVWKVAEEDNIVNYVVEKSGDAIYFTELGTVSLNHNKAGSSVKTYNLSDNAPFKGITYYRLGTTEADGSRISYKTIALDENAKEWEYIYYQQDADLIVEFKNAVPKNSTIDLFDLSGKLLGSKTIDQLHVKMNVNDLASGIYFVRITTAYKTKNFKIVIQK